jgi:phosphatidylglycerol:prolipoprotein diacylglycerol transferase
VYPHLFKIGDTPIYTYGILHLLAIVVLAAFGGIWFRRRGAGAAPAVDGAIWYPIAMFMLAHWAYMAVENEWEAKGLEWLVPLNGGVWGGLIFTIGGLAAYARLRGYPLWLTLDLYSPALLLSLAVGKIGCFLGGCCWGGSSGEHFGLHLAQESRYAYPPGPLHPVPLYDALWAAGACLILVVVSRWKLRPGSLFLLSLIFYAPGRFLTEFLRHDYVGKTLFGGLYPSQLVELATVVLAFLLLIMIRVRGGREEPDETRMIRDSDLPAGTTRGKWWSRAVAFLLDTFFVTAPSICLAAGTMDARAFWIPCALLFLAVHILPRRTPGMWFCGLALRDKHGRPAGIARRLARTVLMPIPWLSLVGIFRPLVSNSGQAFHDMVSGVFVVDDRASDGSTP